VDKISEIVARQEIEESLLRYARGVDRRDWEAVRACFHPDAHDSHGDFNGDPNEFIEWVKARHANIPFAMHFLGNCLIDFVNDDCATVETYFIAIQRREKPDDDGGVSGTDIEVFARYCDRFEKRNGNWRIADRQVVYDSTRTMPSTNHLRTPVGILGQRDQSDPVFLLGNNPNVASVKKA